MTILCAHLSNSLCVQRMPQDQQKMVLNTPSLVSPSPPLNLTSQISYPTSASLSPQHRLHSQSSTKSGDNLQSELVSALSVPSVPKKASFDIQQLLGLGSSTSTSNNSSASPNLAHTEGHQTYERSSSINLTDTHITSSSPSITSLKPIDSMLHSIGNSNVDAYMSRKDSFRSGYSGSVWRYLTNSHHGGLYVRQKVRGPRRQRTTFTHEQTLRLEMEYNLAEYISRSKRFQLAYLLELTENQIKIWFQNRRAKDKRIEKAIMEQQYRYAATAALAVPSDSMVSSKKINFSDCSTCNYTKNQIQSVSGHTSEGSSLKGVKSETL